MPSLFCTFFHSSRQEICALSTETIGADHLSPKRDEMGAKQRKLSEPISTDPIVPVVPQTRTPINAANVATGTATSTTPQPTGTIPPDLTTMSDHDLISYINPSCFDQGIFSDQP